MDTYPFIMVDEYQDTDKSVVDIFLRHLKKGENNRHFVVGFFGDSMQSIYDGKVGSLDEYLKESLVVEVQKPQNRRNPLAVINLANKLRTDKLVQKQSYDKSAPNIDPNTGYVKQGRAVFLYSKNPNLDKVRSFLTTNKDFLWNKNKIKELHLTKNLIANEAGFPHLYEIYSGNELYKYVHTVKKNLENLNIEIDDNRNFKSIVEECEKNVDVDISSIAELPWFSLKKMYVNVDMLMDNKTMEEDNQSPTGSSLSKIVDYILKIMQLIDMYKHNNVGDFLKQTEYKIKSYI